LATKRLKMHKYQRPGFVLLVLFVAIPSVRGL
jgi:hypothetical protein